MAILCFSQWKHLYDNVRENKVCTNHYGEECTLYKRTDVSFVKVMATNQCGHH